MANTVTWDANFEADPDDTDAANAGANEIRELKLAISERLEEEMNFKAGSSPLLKPGIAAVIYEGNTTDIGALANHANGAMAIDTTTCSLKRSNSVSFSNMVINHNTLADRTNATAHTQYLLLTGGNVTGNISMAATKTVDGVDVSNLANAANGDYLSGTFSSANANANNVASSDGFIVAYASCTSIEVLIAGTRRVYNTSASNAVSSSVMCPVSNGTTYRVNFANVAGTPYVYFVALGA